MLSRLQRTQPCPQRRRQRRRVEEAAAGVAGAEAAKAVEFAVMAALALAAVGEAELSVVAVGTTTKRRVHEYRLGNTATRHAR